MTKKEYTHKYIMGLESRQRTDLIVIHHTGDGLNQDLSSADIHRIHIGMGYAGIGYHYVIRKSGLIETGRPEWAIGAHAYSYNSRSIGIHLSGDFNIGYPTMYQTEAVAELIADISKRYGFIIDRQHVKNHCELNSTDCPGKNLKNLIEILCGKANYYRYR